MRNLLATLCALVGLSASAGRYRLEKPLSVEGGNSIKGAPGVIVGHGTTGGLFRVDGRRFLKVVDETGGMLARRNNGVRID